MKKEKKKRTACAVCFSSVKVSVKRLAMRSKHKTNVKPTFCFDEFRGKQLGEKEDGLHIHVHHLIILLFCGGCGTDKVNQTSVVHLKCKCSQLFNCLCQGSVCPCDLYHGHCLSQTNPFLIYHTIAFCFHTQYFASALDLQPHRHDGSLWSSPGHDDFPKAAAVAQHPVVSYGCVELLLVAGIACW